MAFPECQQFGLDCAGVGRGPVYRLVDEIMTVAFLGSLVVLDTLLILWLKRRLQKVERLP